MRRKIVVGVGGALVLIVLGVFLLVRSTFAQDRVRVALAEQLSSYLGQPVAVGTISAAIYPRLTVTLGAVTIGDPVRIRVETLDVGTSLRALFSRRIEHASLRLNGAKVDLPLPAFAMFKREPSSSSSFPVELVSVDEILISGVEVTSRGSTLRGDIEAAVIEEVDRSGVRRSGLEIRRFALQADDSSLTATGLLALAGNVGDIAITAGTLNVDKLIAFADDFSSVAASPAKPRSAPGGPVSRGWGRAMTHIVVKLTAERATMGGMTIDKLSATATVTDSAFNLKPLTFNLFDGRYEGEMWVNTDGEAPTFQWKAALSNVDVAAAAAFAGRPLTISGRLSGQVDLKGHGTDAATAMKTVAGTVRAEVTDGIVKNLGLIRAVVAATSLDAGTVMKAASGSRDEPFSRLGGTLVIGNGQASTTDLHFESSDVALSAAGYADLDGSALAFNGSLQLSEELSKQVVSNAPVMKAAQENGRVTLPAVITGSASNPSVGIDTSTLAKRAIRNTANEQGKKAVQKELDRLFKR